MSQTLAILQSQFPGMFRIPILAAGRALGLADQTVRNQVHRGTFPIASQRVGGRRFVRIDDLARALDAGAQAAAVQKGRPGNPKKEETLRAKALGLSVSQLRRRERVEEAARIAGAPAARRGRPRSVGEKGGAQ